MLKLLLKKQLLEIFQVYFYDAKKNIYKVSANELVDRTTTIGDIPYLDELIDINDDYIYDREKQLSLVRRLFRS